MDRFNALIIAIVVCSAAPLHAEENRTVEVSGGFSLFTVQTSAGPYPDYLAGWHASVAGHLNRYIVLFGDISAHHEDGYWVNQPGVHFCASTVCSGPQQYVPALAVHALVFGPRLDLPRGDDAIFVHLLAGAVRKNPELASTTTGLALGVGGGFDKHLFGPISGRIQLDVLPNRSQGQWDKSYRFGFGIVHKFRRE